MPIDDRPNSPILPGSTIGVLGSGQLGRMFTIAARRMGYRVHTYSPDTDTPTGQVADVEVVAPYDDLDQVRRFASRVAVVTFEFENVPAATAQAAAETTLVRPAGRVLHIAQNRLREKTFLAEHGLPVAPFRGVRSQAELEKALAEIGYPAVLKTAGFGYDGKGQAKIQSAGDIEAAWKSSTFPERVLEAFVDFQHEVSVVAARSLDGDFTHWGVIENTHHNHILDLSLSPARVSQEAADSAVSLAERVLESLDVVGVMCVEFFVRRDGELVINELAPRPHNSGHLTIDAHLTCQFEQQLRAVCGLPLGSTDRLRAAAMANLLGDLWQHGEPNWAEACAIQDVKLHLYGKIEPRPGRKMGHMTALADTAEEAALRVLKARAALSHH
jgi:5-(carboxyamino)imidazole ribonucleotide synthase